MKKWADMSNLSQEFRLRMKCLERNFEVSAVIFHKFEPIFMEMFQNPQIGEPPRQPRSRKHRHDKHNATLLLFLIAVLMAFLLLKEVPFLVMSYPISLLKRWLLGFEF